MNLLFSALLLLQIRNPQIALTDRAILSLDSIAALARRDNLEPGACITSWDWHGDTVILKEIVPGDIKARSSWFVEWRTLCQDTLPVLHGHFDSWRPSSLDWRTQDENKRTPFSLLLLVGTDGSPVKLSIYGVRK